MTRYTLSALCLCVSIIGVSHGWFWSPPSDHPGCGWKMSPSQWERCYPCYPFRTKEVTLVVRNILREPTFEETVTLHCTHSKTLFYMMMEAAGVNNAFKFTVTYFHQWGFFFDAINQLAANTTDQTWWQILDGNDELTPVGASTYRPSDGETVTFNFTQGYGTHS